MSRRTFRQRKIDIERKLPIVMDAIVDDDGEFEVHTILSFLAN